MGELVLGCVDLKHAVAKHGGRLVGGDTRLDGVRYSYKALWDTDEEADEFIEAVDAAQSGRDFINGILTVFFTLKLN